MNPADYTPTRDLVLVRRSELTKTVNGIFIPEPIQPDILEGDIVQVGPDAQELFHIDVTAEKAVYSATGHQMVNAFGLIYAYVPAADVMAVTSPDSPPFLGLSERITRVIGSWVLVSWEEAAGTLLGGMLVRPVERAKAHFTGVVVQRGEDVREIEVGKRYFFEQFSDIKSWHEGSRRYAFVPADAFYCEIPARETEVCLAPSEVASPEFERSLAV